MATIQKKRIMWYSSKSYWKGLSMDITEASRLRDSESIKSKSDGFDFSVNNFKVTSTHTDNANFQNRYISELIDVNDRVTIEYSSGSSAFELVMTGDIDSLKEHDSIDSNTLTIKGVNRTEKLLNSIDNIGSIGDSTTADAIIESVCGSVNDKSDTTKIAAGRWDTQLSADDLSGAGQTFNSGSGLTTSISTAFKGADNGNITLTVYTVPDTNPSFLAGLSSVVFTLTGTNTAGSVITDTVTITSSDNDVTKNGVGVKNFETITSVTYPNTGQTFTNHKIVVGTGGVRSVKSDYSTALSTITYYRTGKPASDYIDELSSDKYTGSVTYIWWVDIFDILQWKPKKKSSATTISRGLDDTLGTEGTDYHSALEWDIERGTFDVITAIRMHCGKDDTGASVSTYRFDSTAVAKYGWKWAYMDKSEIAEGVIEENSGFTTAQIRTEAKRQGKVEAGEVLSRTAYARHRMKSAKFLFTTAFAKSEQLDIVSPRRGWTVDTPYRMRIIEVSHNATVSGIFTYIELEEDEDNAKSNSKNDRKYVQ